MGNDTQPTLWNWKPAKPKRGPKPNGFLRALSIVVQRGHEISEAGPQPMPLAPRYEARQAPIAFREQRPPLKALATHRNAPAKTASVPRPVAFPHDSVPQQAALKIAVTPSTMSACGDRECPRCHHVGRIDTDFGTRIIRGEVKPQSWCRACRRSGGRQEEAAPQMDLLAGAH